MKLMDDQLELMATADEIAEKHAGGFFATTRLINKIKLRTAVFNALCLAAGVPHPRAQLFEKERQT
jgi:hypothetical protein